MSLRRADALAWIDGTPPPTVDATLLAEALRLALRRDLLGAGVQLRLPPTADAWVEAVRGTVEAGPVNPQRVEAVLTTWRGLPRTTREHERLLRLLDDAPRAVAAATWSTLPASHDVPRAAHPAAARLLEALGPGGAQRAEDRQSFLRSARVVLVPTWQCELRCTYCTIPKQDGRVMDVDVAERGVELLLSADAEDHRIHFYGGEPLLNWPVVHHAIQYAAARGAALDRKVSFQITTNTLGATNERLDALVGLPILFQLSLDGTAETQRTNRPKVGGLGDSYAESAADRVRAFVERGFETVAIMVVSRQSVGRLADDFWHLARLGVPRIQVNYAMGSLWPPEARTAFLHELFRLGAEMLARRRAGEHVPRLVNLDEPLHEVRTNGHVTVDWDGTVYGSNSFLYTPALAEGQRLGHLDDALGHDRYALDGFDRDHLLQWSYRDKVARNNTEVGAVLTTFVRWLGDQREAA